MPEQPYPVQLLRFERELFSIDSLNPKPALQQLYQKYGEFYLSYARDILSLPADPADSLFTRPMAMVAAYRPFRILQHTIDSTFGDLRDLQEALGWSMAIYKQEFPKKRVPVFVTFLSEYSLANVMYDSIFGIGLDMYMAETQTPFYRALEFPEFRIQKLKRPYILPNILKGMAMVAYEGQTGKDRRFLATMLFHGKIQYFVKSLAPHMHDSLVMGYSAKQLQWCEDNRAEIWTHFIEKELLYKEDSREFLTYFNDGPFTSADDVPPESAPALGVWNGLQIVEKYMEENPEVTLKQLMDETDWDKILKKSKYRPQ